MLRRLESSSSSAARWAFQAARSRSKTARSSWSWASSWLRSVLRSISSRVPSAGRFFVLAPTALEFAGECPALFLKGLPRLSEGKPLDFQVAVDRGPQVGPLGGDLVAQAENYAFLLFEVADQRFAGADFFVQVVFPGFEVGLPFEDVLFKLVDPQPGTAPLLIEQGVLLVERLFAPFEFLAFAAKMGGNLRGLPKNLLFPPRTAAGRGGARSCSRSRTVFQILVFQGNWCGRHAAGPRVRLVDADPRGLLHVGRRAGL